MTPPNARHLALKILSQVLNNYRELQASLDEHLRRVINDEDKGLITELCYGYLRLKGRVDYLLSLYLRLPEKLPPKVRLILGLAGYELLFLEKIPAYASVSWAVAEVKKKFGRGLANVANAVLRKVSRLDGYDEGLFKQDNPPINIFLSRYCSCPEWIVNLWLKAYGQEFTRLILEQSIAKPPLGIRIDDFDECFDILLKKAADRGITLACQPPVVALRGPKSVINQLLHHINYSRQSYAGQQVILELDPKSWPEPIWDACAGRGGKTFLLYRLGRKVLASDVNLGRIKGLKAESIRLNTSFPYFVGSVFDPPLKIRPSTILLDVPCSGLGVISRRPDIKWKRKPEDMQKFISAQSRMLQRAVMLLPSGGELIYVTCTLNPEENEGQIKRLIKENKSLHLVGTFQTDENMGLNEFFFGARLRKF
jgi:16S rRNA (cytosine967-C5)-methyltransferase